MNSCTYDPTPNSFDCPPDSYHPPHPTYETYSYEFGYDCQPQFPLNYESEQGYNENYTSYPYDSSSLPQQYPCCTRCGGPHMNFQCQPMNQDSYSLGFDQPQPPQSSVIHQPPQELSIQEMDDLKSSGLILALILVRASPVLSKRLTSFCYDDDDDDDYNSAITPVLSTKEPIDSLSMGDEYLDTIPATESDEVIKSSVEDLVPIPSESEGIPEHMCDVPFHDNSPPLDVSNDQIEDSSESNNEVSSIDDNSFSIYKIDYVEASPPNSELVSSEISSGSTTTYSDISLPDYEAFYFDDGHIKDISSGSTITHSDISLSEYDSFIFNLAHEEFVDELTHIISPPEYECFYFWNLPDPGELMSVLNSRICENLPSATSVNLPIEDDYSPLWHMLYVSLLLISRIPLFLLIFTHSGMKIPSLTQASPSIIFIHLSLVHLIGMELSRNSVLTVVT
nr:hypothetical protein [Tanacetum cinerariifolium]